MGTAQVPDHPRHLLHHQRHGPSRCRLPALQAPGPQPRHPTHHVVSTRLLCRWHRSSSCQVPRRELQRARVLVVCSETTTVLVRAPSEEHQDDLVAQALFADGASALIVGADPNEDTNERPLFTIFSTSQVILPDSDGAIGGHVGEGGLTATLHRDVPLIISKNVSKCLEQAFLPLGISDWNSIFWAPHPGGRAILDQVEERVGLKPEKLWASRHVLAEYGNMSSVCVHFVLDELRKRSIKEGKSTTGEGLEWGVLFGFGPGLTVETVVLRSVALN
ncbi:hypothetical protein HPP92_022718 [Vanilla planifolia]|uniref:Chalcone synthase n=1 Tax=Vanilla planifolia TaxID=51239 RepID=A0A835PSI0_VANPL|nr:hypothetical protein HPP92_022718 [Vanilla planifolia]